MYENIAVFIIISMLLYSSKKKRAMGWLVLSYYSVFIIIALDYLGLITSTKYIGYDASVYWYLVCTGISAIFFVASVTVSIVTHTKTPLFYAAWILFNMFISGLSAIFQAFETTSLLFWYNLLQDSNLIVDLTVVIIGTDSIISRERHIAKLISRASHYIDSKLFKIINYFNRNLPCHQQS